MMNKPAGCITARTDDEGRQTVYAHVPAHFPALGHVGRLDYNTEGLLLFTDDGRLSQALLNKAFSGAPVEKVYHVKIKGIVEDGDARLARLEEPLKSGPGKTTEPARARVVERRDKTSWIELVICEGRHRQVRKLCERSGLQIRKLRRMRLGPLELGELRLRWCRPLERAEVAALYAAALADDALPDFEAIDNSAEAYRRARAALAAD
ncbi:MAG: rRNA pseudouridine synthase [Bradymonadaceae bacterium]|nr:rRNA pseudouridine synthase [Lujinxingiaceae bacterium]